MEQMPSNSNGQQADMSPQNARTSRWLIFGISFGLLSLLLLAGPTPTAEAAAHDSQATGIEMRAGAPAPVWFGSYVYQAEKGDNLTYLARRSIQFYLADSKLELQGAQAIAAETFIVQDLGAFELAVGQEVSIDITLVGHSVLRASLLDDRRVDCWSAYEPVRTNLSHITPVKIPLSLGGLAAEDGAPVEPQANTATDTTPQAGAEALAEKVNATAVKDNSFYLFILGIMVLVGIVVWVLALSFLRDTRKEAVSEVKAKQSAKTKSRRKTEKTKVTSRYKSTSKQAQRKRAGKAKKKARRGPR